MAKLSSKSDASLLWDLRRHVARPEPELNRWSSGNRKWRVRLLDIARARCARAGQQLTQSGAGSVVLLASFSLWSSGSDLALGALWWLPRLVGFTDTKIEQLDEFAQLNWRRNLR